MKKSRRGFVRGILTALAALLAWPAVTQNKTSNSMYHHVFFWLNNPASKDDLRKLIAGLRTLGQVSTVRNIRVGVPASTADRDVVDHSFNASLLLFFDDVEGQEAYQKDPIHLKFVEGCSMLWTKVIVYDTADV